MTVSAPTTEILLVDDNPDALTTMQRMLERVGEVEVFALDSPSQALEEILANPSRFDLVVLDYNMPEMFGGELAAEIRDINPEVPIVCITGFLPKDFYAPVFTDVLRKPVKIDDLRNFIARYLEWNR